MSRPDPEILLRYEPEDDPGTTQVCEAHGSGLYVVLYKRQAFQLRKKNNREVSYPGWKYLRVAYSGTPAHACRLAERLNKMFACEDFTVSEMTYGRNIPVK
jgi:hypothetical protein